MEPITWNSTREEVMAAVAEHERRVAASRVPLADDEIDWRGDPPGQREGCYSSKDGQVLVHVGRCGEDPTLARQNVAGEEDQSLPGWDQGA